jgi:hypothetical protein
MGIIKKYHDKKWILQFLGALYNSIDCENVCISADTQTHQKIYFKVSKNFIYNFH